jgi:hypothetical protein
MAKKPTGKGLRQSNHIIGVEGVAGSNPVGPTKALTLSVRAF